MTLSMKNIGVMSGRLSPTLNNEMQFLSKQKKFKEIKDNFLKFIKDKTLIIHNAEFDLAHLNNELLLNGRKKIENEVIDTLELARTKFPGSASSLDALDICLYAPKLALSLKGRWA